MGNDIKICNRISYSGFNSEQNDTLNKVIRLTYDKASRLNGREIALVYDLNLYCNYDGVWLFEVLGESDTDRIDLSSNTDVMHLLHDFEQNHIVVISHNHPNNKPISLLDIQTFVQAKNIKMLVAVMQSGKIAYIVKKNFDINKFNRVKSEIVKKYPRDSFDKYNQDLLERASEYGVYYYCEV